MDAGYQCFSVVAQARLQDSPKASPRADRVRGRKGEHKTYCMYNYSYSHSISNWPAQQALTSASARKGEHQGLIPLKKQLLTVLFGNDGRQEKNMFFVAQCCPFARSPRCIKMLGLCFRVLWKFYVHQNCSKTVYHIREKYELILERQKNRPTRQQVSILERTTVRQKCQF